MGPSIAVVVGSLRRDSFNRRLAQALVALPQGAGHDFTFPQIGDLPNYDQDQDDDQPAPVRRLKREILASEAVIFVTPEYNRSIPGVLKNAIDHASRPYGQSAWKGKPAGILGISPGPIGTAAAQQHLRNILAALDMPTLAHPEAYVSMSHQPFADDGSLSPKTAKLLGVWLETFLAHAARNRNCQAAEPGIE
jgi:chromate reductase